ncbi:hypothetical protein ACFLRO_00750 [Bacteroidota bacterium]
MLLRYQLSSTILIALFALTNAANAQIGVGPLVGIAFDGSDLFVGGNATIPMGFQVAEQNLILNPGASYYLIDNVTLFIIDVNLLYPFAAGSFNAYAGAGLLVSFWSADYGDVSGFLDDLGIDTSSSSTDFGLNVKGGAEFGEGSIRPFGEVGFQIKDGGSLYAQGGARFQLGGS